MEERGRGFDVCGRGFARQNGVIESGDGEDEVDYRALYTQAYSLRPICRPVAYIDRYKLSIENWCRQSERYSRRGNMSKKFTIGVNRAVGVKKQGGDLCITIAEQGTDKSAEFNTKRWVQFVRIFNQIDESLQQIAAKQYVKYCTHIGGKWFVSVTTGFACVDVRQFYYHRYPGTAT
jgi:hypothetical protein